MISFNVQKLLSFIESILLIFAPVSFAWGDRSKKKKKIAKTYVKEDTVLFSYRSLFLLFRLLINLVSFVYGVRKCSDFTLLCPAVQFSQCHLLKRFFSPLCIPASFAIDQLTICVWVYFWTFYFFSFLDYWVHWSVCLWLCCCHTVLITVALY